MSAWPIKPLGKLCEVLDRYRKPITKSGRRPGPYPYYGAMGIVDYVDGFLFDEPLILLGEDGAKWDSGELCAFKVDGKYWVNNHAHIVRPDRSQILDDWLVYYLCGTDLLPFVTGLTVPKLNQERMREIPIPVPPLEEQRRIVAVLDEAFAAIATATANAERNLANARELFESAFRERFDHVGNGWDTFRLPDIAENWDYLRRPVTKSDRVPGDIPYYGASGRVDGVRDHLFDDDLLLISEDGANLLMRTYPIAFSIAGKSWVNNHAHILKFDDMATQRLVEYYFNSISIAPWVSGMAQPKLNQKALNCIPVPLPPEDEREKLVIELDELADGIEKLKANQEERLAILAALKQSLLHRAFTGELTAAVPEAIAA